ncbi:MAG: FAD binding domain-containing protein [Deltaproteobacteria bacterium]|nr:FAD binding domain-containing protein [Deltaproteobacteria bacterium]
MKPYHYQSAETLGTAVATLKKGKAAILAGGTDLLNVLKQGALAEPPETLVNIKRLPGLRAIAYDRQGLAIGALTTLTELAESPLVKEKYPALAQAASLVAGPTLRNMGTVGGNLCQEVQCWYFRRSHLTGTWFDCLRKGGNLCYAVGGDNRFHSIAGGIKVQPSQCSKYCPAGTNIPAYLERIRAGQFDAAAKVLLEVNPLAAITGRICPHFCEKACNLKDYNQALSVKNIERFVGDRILKNPARFLRLPEREKKQRIAVIGSGPAGLSAAFFLRKAGYGVTIFETMPVAGGTMALTIPHYRLPAGVLKKAIAFIESHGITIKTRTAIGKAVTIPQLLKKGYKAVFIAVGAQEGRKLRIPGSDLKGVMTALDFLSQVKKGRKTELGKRLLVIGGGSVAFDCARTARRLGVKEVRMACLESLETMPADSDEIREGQAEGVKLHPGLMTTAIQGKNGRVSGVEALSVSSLVFKDGIPQVTTTPGSESALAADTVIFAVGQVPDLSAAAGVKGLKISRMGTIDVDPETLSTGVKGIYAGGDAWVAAGSVIQAIACGKKAANAIHRFCGGRSDIAPSQVQYDSLLAFNGAGSQTPRVETPERPVKERLKDIKTEVVQGLPEPLIVQEANRCRNCGCVAVNASDLATMLTALNALIKTTKRVIPAEQFFAVAGHKTTVLDDDEIVVEIRVPTVAKEARQAFIKFAQRPAIDFAVVNAASLLKMTGGKVLDARLVLGAVAPMPFRAFEAEALLKGKAVTEALAEKAAATLEGKAILLSGNQYKLQIAKALLKRAILGEG